MANGVHIAVSTPIQRVQSRLFSTQKPQLHHNTTNPDVNPAKTHPPALSRTWNSSPPRLAPEARVSLAQLFWIPWSVKRAQAMMMMLSAWRGCHEGTCVALNVVSEP